MLIAANKNYLRARRISQQGGDGGLWTIVTQRFSRAVLNTKKKIRKNQLKIENWKWNKKHKP